VGFTAYVVPTTSDVGLHMYIQTNQNQDIALRYHYQEPNKVYQQGLVPNE
jgi:hypothetical protein